MRSAKGACAGSRTLEVDGVGLVVLERSLKARRISISVRPLQRVRVAVPRGVSFNTAAEFVHTRTDWMKKHLGRMEAEALEHSELMEGFAMLDRATARRRLVRRLDELSERFRLPYNRVFVRSQKTRWGSCSVKKNINLNLRLACLPDGLMDYVITHELVHTRIMNHGKTFWAELDRCVPGARVMDRELRKYRLILA